MKKKKERTINIELYKEQRRRLLRRLEIIMNTYFGGNGMLA